MDNLEKIIACFKEVEFTPKIDKFQDRFIIQKSVCTLELMGLDLGYKFSLYVNGPYSPDLAHDVYSHKEKVENLKSTCQLSVSEQEKVKKVYELSNHFDPRILEIIATYSFIWKGLNIDSNQALIHLKKLKPYPDTQIAVGVSKAKQLFPPTEKEIREMKAEFKAWEDASEADAS